MPGAVEEPAPAEIAYAGTWRLEPAEASESATLALRYAPSSSNSSSPIALAKLGLTFEAFAHERRPLRFELAREAGTFACRGTAGEGRGDGAFTFRPDPRFADAIAEIGLPPLTLRQHVQAGMFDISSRTVGAIVATGLQHVTFSQLLGLSIFRITPEHVSALKQQFPNATLDDIRSLAMTGVTDGYVEALRRANVSGLSADNVSALRASGIDRPFIEGLAVEGRYDLSIDEVARLYNDS